MPVSVGGKSGGREDEAGREELESEPGKEPGDTGGRTGLCGAVSLGGEAAIWDKAHGEAQCQDHRVDQVTREGGRSSSLLRRVGL